jgi:hypothetical protein
VVEQHRDALLGRRAGEIEDDLRPERVIGDFLARVGDAGEAALTLPGLDSEGFCCEAKRLRVRGLRGYVKAFR